MARKTIKELQEQIRQLQEELKEAKNDLKVPLDETDRIYFWLGRAASKIRTQRAITQEEMAARLNISRTSLANMEAGNQRAQLHVWMSLSRRMKISFINLIEHADAMAAEWAETQAEKSNQVLLGIDRDH